MRTTLELDERLYSEAQRRASRRGSTLTEVVEDALRAAFDDNVGADDHERSSLPIFVPVPGQEGLNPGFTWDKLGCDTEDLELEIDGTR